MDYYTDFSLEIRKAMTYAEAKEIITVINKAIWTTLEDGEEGLFSIDNSGIEDDAKIIWHPEACDDAMWYSWETDMKKIAKEYPDIEFRLEGGGADKDDWWVALFKGDKFQIRYCVPPIDEWEDEE